MVMAIVGDRVLGSTTHSNHLDPLGHDLQGGDHHEKPELGEGADGACRLGGVLAKPNRTQSGVE